MSVKLNLSKAQLSKLRNGHAVQLKSNQIGQGNTSVSLHPSNIKKLTKAVRQGKGVRVQLNHDEIMGSGFMSQAKSMGKAALKNKQIRKLANQGLDRGMNMASDYAVAQGADEGMVNFVKKQARKGVDRELNNFVEGSGFMSQAKSMGKAALKNKQIRKLANQGLDRGMNMASDYAVAQGADEGMVNFVKKQARKGVDRD
jgi:hypothetical protein